jgi:hypothetical protein
MGVCLIGVLALGAQAASSAWATAPEYGRCLKQNAGTGKQFSDSKCTKEVTKGSSKDKYEWLPGASKGKFTTSGGVGVLTTVGGAGTECQTESSTGEFVPGNNKEETNVVVKFNGCKTLEAPCSSPGAERAEIRTNELEGIVGWENKAKKKTALELHPAKSVTSGLFTEFACLGLVIKVRGNVLVPLKNDTMTETLTLNFVAKKGKQKPEKWEGPEGKATETAILEASFHGEPFEQAGQNILVTLKGEEKLELNAVV